MLGSLPVHTPGHILEFLKLLAVDWILRIYGVVQGKVSTESHRRRANVPTSEEHTLGELVNNFFDSRNALLKGLDTVQEGGEQRIGKVRLAGQGQRSVVPSNTEVVSNVKHGRQGTGIIWMRLGVCSKR
jgi:hypothetical protein